MFPPDAASPCKPAVPGRDAPTAPPADSLRHLWRAAAQRWATLPTHAIYNNDLILEMIRNNIKQLKIASGAVATSVSPLVARTSAQALLIFPQLGSVPQPGLAAGNVMHTPGHGEKCFPPNLVTVTTAGKPFKVKNMIF